jgi:hypothetical protein
MSLTPIGRAIDPHLRFLVPRLHHVIPTTLIAVDYLSECRDSPPVLAFFSEGAGPGMI